MNITEQEENLRFLHGLFAVAWADRIIQDEEKMLLRNFVDSLDLSDAGLKLSENWFSTPVSINDIDWAAMSAETQVFLYQSALRVAMADGVISFSERKILQDLRANLTLPEDVLSGIESGDEINPESLGL